MVKRAERGQRTAQVTQTTQVQKATNLKELKSKTNQFMMKKGTRLLGAGKLPSFSDRAPSSSKRVLNAARAAEIVPAAKRQKR